mmetsp:Transcript_30848/g.80723  ORF Transcript_30848/g.80723 Transcript_30848/m.80723 type:complete len:224 (-) Transcript_30848:949-1620(-)
MNKSSKGAHTLDATSAEEVKEKIAGLNAQIASLQMHNEELQTGGANGSSGKIDRSIQEELDKKDLLIDELRRLVEEETSTDDVEDIIAEQVNTIAELRQRLRYASRDALEASREAEKLYVEKDNLQLHILKLLGKSAAGPGARSGFASTGPSTTTAQQGSGAFRSGFSRAASVRAPSEKGGFARSASTRQPGARTGGGFTRAASERRPGGRFPGHFPATLPVS